MNFDGAFQCITYAGNSPRLVRGSLHCLLYPRAHSAVEVRSTPQCFAQRHRRQQFTKLQWCNACLKACCIVCWNHRQKSKYTNHCSCQNFANQCVAQQFCYEKANCSFGRRHESPLHTYTPDWNSFDWTREQTARLDLETYSAAYWSMWTKSV